MPKTWEIRDYDREFFAKELDDFVPERMFDAHAHLFERARLGHVECRGKMAGACFH